MRNKIIIPTVLFIIVLLFSFFVLSQEKEMDAKSSEEVSQVQNGIVFFYGDGCPHCAIVEEYMKENKVTEKLDFSKKEVYYNLNNSKELEEKAKACGMATDSIGVPLLWDGKECFVGDQDIIEFFKSKINI